ncbi:MAG: hypothetical protein H5U40_11235, partial [Polyangiaceae bacterium]|nr:hypothetical protein [Polyangiaceae bacterium]
MAASHRHADIAQALLEAHVRFTLDELTGRELSLLIERVLDTVLEQAEYVALADAVKPEAIKAVARAHAIEIELKGGIPELVGKIVKQLHAHPIHERVTLGDVFTDRRVEKVVDHALELVQLRAR